MQLEDYLDFEITEIEPFGNVETIRVKGTRIGIEFIINPYLQGDSPERIFQGYRHNLSLEQVYAAITYYLHNKSRIEEYLKRGKEITDFNYQEHLKKGPSEFEQRLRNLKASKEAAKVP
jgi:uncharacterized protein (DUF433 family)